MRRPGLREIGRLGQAVMSRNVPVYVHFGITHRCNLTCRMCGIWRFGNKAEELSIDQIREMAALFQRLGVFQVAIGGGEPFQRDDLEEAVRAFLGAGVNLRVLTNGVDIPFERLEGLSRMGLTDYSISLDSLYPAKFDHICEREGAWDAALRTITAISELNRGRRALPTLNCVVSHVNLEELPDLARFARALGFAISFLPIELLDDPQDAAKGSDGAWEARFVRFRPEMKIPLDAQTASRVAERVDRAYDAILGLKRKGYPILNSTPYLESSRHYLKTGRFPAEGCDAGRLYFSVAPNGQFTICHRTQQHHKHILDPAFEAYFHSREYERARAFEAASCEGCMRACWIDTSSTFRTVRGLFEQARLQVQPRISRPISFDDARGWAREERG